MADLLAGTWLLASSFAACFFCARRLGRSFSLLERLAACVPLSFAVSSLVVFVSSLALGGLSVFSIFFSCVVFTAAAFLLAGGGAFSWSELRVEAQSHKKFFAAAAFLLLLLSFLFSTHFLEQRSDGVYSGGSTWGDAGIHLTLANSFTLGVNSRLQLPLANPIFAGESLAYPFLPDFHAAALAAGGFSLRDAFLLPSILLAAALTTLLYFFGLRFGAGKNAAVAALLLVFFAGGLGFLQFPNDFSSSGKGLPEFLSALPVDYTHVPSAANYFWISFVSDVLLPQRSALYAYPLVLVVFLSLLAGLERSSKRERSKLFLAAGACAGLLPLLQAHAFAAAALACAVILLARFRPPLKQFVSDAARVAAPAFLLALPQLALLSSAVSRSNFIRPAVFWGGSVPDFFSFWWVNLGLLFVLSLAGFFLLDSRQKRIYAGFLALFLAANFVVFQPWEVDNTKLFYAWLFAGAVVAAIALDKMLLTGKSFAYKIVFAVVFVLLVASGALSLVRESTLHYRLFSPQDMEFGEWIARNTPPQAVFLSSDWHLHPVPALAGRQVVMGYRGWLWSHGIGHAQREREVLQAFAGGPEAVALLEKFGVGYVVIGESELRDFRPNEQFFASNYKRVYYAGGYSVYKIR